MIIIKLLGGLGNQMFQYAIGRQLSNIYDSKLFLDLSFLLDKAPKENFTFRNFELSEFNIKAECKSNFEFDYLYNNSLISKVRRKIGRINLILESDMRFNPSVLLAGKNIYLDGYWQSEKYFEKIRSQILADFSIKKSISDKINNKESVKEIKDLIERTNSVSIHFRRGDYINNDVINSVHGICNNQYYYNAINLILNKVHSPHFFLFSDDPEWLLNTCLQIDIPITIASTSDKHLDMYLMSLCKHNIIANSSFSWWGAWLNPNPEKMVIAPQKWFAIDDLNQQTKDLLPQNWIRI